MIIEHIQKLKNERGGEDKILYRTISLRANMSPTTFAELKSGKQSPGKSSISILFELSKLLKVPAVEVFAAALECDLVTLGITDSKPLISAELLSESQFFHEILPLLKELPEHSRQVLLELVKLLEPKPPVAVDEVDESLLHFWQPDTTKG